jgi:hypothetical protein
LRLPECSLIHMCSWWLHQLVVSSHSRLVLARWFVITLLRIVQTLDRFFWSLITSWTLLI